MHSATVLLLPCNFLWNPTKFTSFSLVLVLVLMIFRSHQHLNSSSIYTTSVQPQVQNKLLFATDFVMDEQLAVQCKAEEMFSHCMQLVKRLASLRLAKEEYLVLKALLLTNVGEFRPFSTLSTLLNQF